MNTRDDDVQPFQQLGLLVERAVVEDVDLDPGQQPKRRQAFVHLGDHIELLAQPLRRKPVRDRRPRRMVGQRAVLVPQRHHRLGHLLDRRAPVRPVRVRVQVTAQGGPHRIALRRERSGFAFELAEV